MDYNFNSMKVWRILLKWKYHLIIIGVLVGVFGAIFSGPRFIIPLYKSYAVVYPDNLKPYSEESTTEQMIQIMESQDITDSMINKFMLAKRYDIKPDYKYFRTAVLGLYHKNVRISKTSYEAVDITVLDKNPDTAKMMVDALLRLFNNKVRSMQKEKYRELANAYAGQLKRKRITMDSLRKRLVELGKSGIFEYDYQSQQITKAYLQALSGPPENIKLKVAKKLMKEMGKYSGELVQTMKMLSQEAATYVDVKLSYEVEYRHVASNVTYTNVITYPFVPDKKSYPVRWFIVLISIIGTITLALIIIAWFERKD